MHTMAMALVFSKTSRKQLIKCVNLSLLKWCCMSVGGIAVILSLSLNVYALNIGHMLLMYGCAFGVLFFFGYVLEDSMKYERFDNFRT